MHTSLIMEAWIIAFLLPLLCGLTSSSRLKTAGYMSDQPEPRCTSIGQMLVNRADPCSYLVCDYGRMPQKDTHTGKHKLFVRSRPCAPGTSVPRDYEKTAKLLGNPCTKKAPLICQRRKPRFYSTPGGKMFKDDFSYRGSENRPTNDISYKYDKSVKRQVRPINDDMYKMNNGQTHPNTIIKMVIRSKDNMTSPDMVHGMMEKVWHQITSRMQELDHRRQDYRRQDLKKFPLPATPDFTHRMTDLENLWNDMKSGVEVILKNKAYGRKRNAAEVTKRMRELQQLWLKMWRKISELHTLEIQSIHSEPLPVADSLSSEHEPVAKRSSANVKFQLPAAYYTKAPATYKPGEDDYSTDGGYSNRQVYIPKPPRPYTPKHTRVVYSGEQKSSDYTRNYGKHSIGNQYSDSGPERVADSEAVYHPSREADYMQQNAYPPVSQEYLPPSQRSPGVALDGYQRSKRNPRRDQVYEGNQQYEESAEESAGRAGYGNAGNYDTYTIEAYEKAMPNDNRAPGYRSYDEQVYDSPYQKRGKYGYEDNMVESEGYGEKRKEEERPTPPLETIDENRNTDIMVPSGFGSEMPLKNLWMEMKGVLGYMMENGKLEAANIPDETDGEYEPSNRYYGSNDIQTSSAGSQVEFRPNSEPGRKYKYPEGRQLFGSSPSNSNNNPGYVPPQGEPLLNGQNYNGGNTDRHYSNEGQLMEENSMNGRQAPIVPELDNPQTVNDRSHPEAKLEDFNVEDFDQAYANSVSQWRHISTNNKE